MKLNSTLKRDLIIYAVSLAVALGLVTVTANAQVTAVCTDPNTIIYGLTGSGVIQEINVNTGATGTVVKNSTYSGNTPNRSNGLGYNYLDGMFYYFKRNVSSGSQEFVSFNPSTGVVTNLAASSCTDDVHTGCVNAAGTGYYTVDVDGNLNYYDIVNNNWTLITSTIVDQYGNDVDAVIRSQSAGDMSIDGWGNIWLVTASNNNYGLYRFPGSLPTTPVASFVVTEVVPPSATTPTGQSFAGIAFNPEGQIYMATKSGNRLYRMETNMSLTYIGNLGTSDIGNDLTSCSFPYRILPVLWKDFSATVEQKNNVKLSWEVFEQNNTGYMVEQSLDGKSWISVHQVAALNNPNDLTHYEYTSYGLGAGMVYFRIRQTSLDGKVSYSEVRKVTIAESLSASIAVWPNPTRDKVQVMNETESGKGFQKIRVMNLNGSMLLEKQLTAGLNTIGLEGFRSGTYILTLTATDGRQQTQKIIKQ